MNKSDYSGHRQRLKERFLHAGERGLCDHELLELLLCYAIPRRDVKPLAKELFRKFHSLHSVFMAQTAELLQVKGVSMHTAILLQMGRNIFIKCLQYDIADAPVLDTTRALELYLRMQFACNRNEQMFLLLLNKNCRLVEKFSFPGLKDMVYCNSQEIFKSILFHKNVATVVLAHNHPQGCDVPSENDLVTTKRLQFLLKAFNIQLKDHLIITPDKCISILSSELFHPFEPQNF